MADRKDTYPGPKFIPAPSFEMPVWSGRLISNESRNGYLPIEALMAGYELRELRFAFDDDPWYLYDPHGRIIKEWKLRPPSMTEVFELCAQLLRRL